MFCGRDIEDGRAERDEEMVVGNKVRQEQEDSKVQANEDKEKKLSTVVTCHPPHCPGMLCCSCTLSLFLLDAQGRCALNSIIYLLIWDTIDILLRSLFNPIFCNPPDCWFAYSFIHNSHKAAAGADSRGHGKASIFLLSGAAWPLTSQINESVLKHVIKCANITTAFLAPCSYNSIKIRGRTRFQNNILQLLMLGREGRKCCRLVVRVFDFAAQGLGFEVHPGLLD